MEIPLFPMPIAVCRLDRRQSGDALLMKRGGAGRIPQDADC
jgi:hypothetical protein